MSTLIKRYFFFILGLIINSFGVAFITKSALGTIPDLQHSLCAEPEIYKSVLWTDHIYI